MNTTFKRSDKASAIDVTSARITELIFLSAGATLCAVVYVLQQFDHLRSIDLRGVIAAVVFAAVNLHWWKIIVRLMLLSTPEGTRGRHGLFVVHLAFKIFFLLLVIYGLSGFGRAFMKSFLIGFVGFLLLGSVYMFLALRLTKSNAPRP